MNTKTKWQPATSNQTMQATLIRRPPSKRELADMIECLYQYGWEYDPYSAEREDAIRWFEHATMTVHEQPGQPTVITVYQTRSPEFYQLYSITPDGKTHLIHQHQNMRLGEGDE